MSIIVEVEGTAIPDGIISLIQNLPRPGELVERSETIVLHFPDKFIYRTGLVLLSTWRKTLPPSIEVRVDDSDCHPAAQRLIENSGFKDLIESNLEASRNSGYQSTNVAIQPLVRGYSTEQTVAQICGILDSASGGLNISAFRVLLSELCENVFAHSEFELPGYISADLHGGYCEIVIADSGIGIYKSYLEGTNEEAKRQILGGSSSIELALNGLSSSKPTPPPGMLRSHYGYGLFIVRRLIEENEGRLTVISGSECISIERYSKMRPTIAPPWNGTFVGMLLNLNKPLPLEAVYEEGVEMMVSPISSSTSSAARVTPAPPVVEGVEFALSNYGSQLLTREVGVTIRADMATILASGRKINLSLEGVEDLTPSVADECFGKLAESMGEESFRDRVSLVGGHPLLQRLVEFVIRTRLGK